jgi:hypothetical protein
MRVRFAEIESKLGTTCAGALLSVSFLETLAWFGVTRLALSATLHRRSGAHMKTVVLRRQPPAELPNFEVDHSSRRYLTNVAADERLL